jgi:hypothetical protein
VASGRKQSYAESTCDDRRQHKIPSSGHSQPLWLNGRHLSLTAVDLFRAWPFSDRRRLRTGNLDNTGDGSAVLLRFFLRPEEKGDVDQDWE